MRAAVNQSKNWKTDNDDQSFQYFCEKEN
jgi:hypothetical protein